MNEFWKWMLENNYAIDDCTLLDGAQNWCTPTDEMLVGYMLKYIIENGDKMLCVPLVGYSFLEKEIEELKNKED
ncbi:MAG: hypothetical protein GY853_01550 [PVC group bacterium]|nr:hypothetical protein [PVC group bacterium]